MADLHQFEHVPQNWCGPESVTRSIDYLAKVHDNVSLPNGKTADDVMKDIQKESGAPVGPDKLKAAKDKFNSDNKIPITTTKDYWGANEMPKGKIDEIMKKLCESCDIEIFMRGEKARHVAMVQRITKHADGSYTVEYVDQRQCNKGAKVRSQTIRVQADGKMTGDMGKGTVSGFLIECVDKPLLEDSDCVVR